MWTANLRCPGARRRPGPAARAAPRSRAASEPERLPSIGSSRATACRPGGIPSVARSGEIQFASARSSASSGTSAALASAPARRSSSSGSAIPKTRLAASVAGSSAETPRWPARCSDVGAQRRRGRGVRAITQQVVAPGAAKPRQRESLEDALEAARGRPGGVAGERGGCAARVPLARPRTARRGAAALHPLQVGEQRPAPRAGSCELRGPSGDALEVGQRRRTAGCEQRGRAGRSGGDRSADAGERVLALGRREVGEQEARPGGALEVLGGAFADLAVEAGRLGRRARAGARSRRRAPRASRCGVGARAQARDELAAVAVVAGAALAADAQARGPRSVAPPAAAPGVPLRGRRRRTRAAAGRRAGLVRARSVLLQIGQRSMKRL